MKKYIQLTAGRGPVECARAVTLVARELLKDFPDAGLIESEAHNTEADCYISLLFLAETNPDKEKEWQGTVLWQEATANRFRPGHPRKNWYIGVHFIDPMELPEISDKNIVFETMRSRGHGGQRINKVETAVRATHVPSGLSVRCADERSQSQNKLRAKERLLMKLFHQQKEKIASAKHGIWNNHVFLVRGNTVKRFSGPL